MKLKRIGVLSAGKVGALLYGMIGILAGLFLSFFSMIGLFAASQVGDFPAAFAPFLGLSSIIVLPLFYGALGFIAGVVSAAFYNLIAAMVGGIEVELEEQPGLPPEHVA